MSDNNLKERWAQCLDLLRTKLSDQQMEWFKPIRPKSYDEEEHKLILTVPSNYFLDYVETNFRTLLHGAVYRIFYNPTAIFYQVNIIKGDKEGSVEEPSTGVEAREGKRGNKLAPKLVLDTPKPKGLNSGLNPQQTFENFIEGKSNKLSRSVAQAIADNPSQQTFNPLFLWGPSGVGKTHLVNALGVRLQKLYPTRRVLYIPAHDFLVQFTESRRLNKFNEFIQFYQSIEVLIVDDVHEFTSQQKTLEAFFHIFNHLHQNGRKIILTCDRPPSELVGMEARILSRFRWGITVEMERPEEELRYNILMSKILRGGLRIPEEVVHYIAHTIKSNVRELEGAIHSLQAYSIVENAEITLEFARHVLEKNAITKPQPKSKRTTFDYILDRVAEQMGVEVSDILGRGRKADVALARQMVMYLASRHTDLSTPRIGTLLGGRSHTTVLHGVDVIADDEELKNRAEKML